MKKETSKTKKNKKVVNKDLKNVKGLFTSIIVMLAKAIYLLIKNLIWIGYILIFNLDEFISKLFMKLPRIMRVIAIYSLVIISVIYFIGLDKTTKIEAKESKIEYNIKSEEKSEPKVEEKEDSKIEEKELEQLEKVEKQEEPKTNTNKSNCKLGTIPCKIYNNAISKGMTHDQALIVTAISKHETGNWTSSAFKNKNNFGGMMSNGKIKTFNNFDDGMNAFTNLLKNYYFKNGRTTISKIGAIYCPVANDKTGLNKNWIPRVTEYYNNYKKQF